MLMNDPMKRSEEDVGGWEGVENLEHRLRKMSLIWFGDVNRRDENSILGEQWSWRWKVEG